MRMEYQAKLTTGTLKRFELAQVRQPAKSVTLIIRQRHTFHPSKNLICTFPLHLAIMYMYTLTPDNQVNVVGIVC